MINQAVNQIANKPVKKIVKSVVETPVKKSYCYLCSPRFRPFPPNT